MIKYQIKLNPGAHIFTVKLTFIPTNSQQLLKLPTWIPGSYMIREFSKNIIDVTAKQNHQQILLEQIDKNTWQVDNLKINKEVTVIYNVYAYDFGIRTAYLDDDRAYFNATSLCLYVVGTESNEHIISFDNIPYGWEVATALKTKQEDNYEYYASNYDELIDSPFEISYLSEYSFKVKNVEHKIAINGVIPLGFDSKRLIADVSKICETQINLFGGEAPFETYTFLLHLGGSIYTGLEHRSSTALLAPYYSVPIIQNTNATNKNDISPDYLKLLGLISHEYFHSWNVKRIKPHAFSMYDLNNENYTKQLWWFEGITSYYDDLMLLRSGVIDSKCYLKLILDNINNVYKYDGAHQQTLENSSLTSWVKYYRQDENSPNTIVSYYVKGALVGMCLDILIRQKTNNTYSLDNVMRGLFNKWQVDGLGIQDDELHGLIEKFANCELKNEIHEYVATVNKLPLKNILSSVGLKLYEKTLGIAKDEGKIIQSESELDKLKVTALDLGCKLVKENIGYRVVTVYNNSLGQYFGLATNDMLIALNGIRLENIEKQLSCYNLGDEIELTYFRREQLMTETVLLEKPYNGYPQYFIKVSAEDKLAKWLQT